MGEASDIPVSLFNTDAKDGVKESPPTANAEVLMKSLLFMPDFDDLMLFFMMSFVYNFWAPLKTT
jgi:hypothetical protein